RSARRARPPARLPPHRGRNRLRRLRLLRPPLRARGRPRRPQHDRRMSFADPRGFLYRSLDPEEAKRLAGRHLAGHDDGELYLQYKISEAFGFDDGRLKTADYNSASGFGLRGVSGETT